MKTTTAMTLSPARIYFGLLFAALFLPLSLVKADEAQFKPQKLTAPAKLISVGSDSMEPLMDGWVEAYKKLQPEVQFEISNRGSSTAAVALLEGSADLGPMARPMKKTELGEFRARYGYEPTQVRTGIAAIGIYVPAKLDLKQITISQLERIYAAEPRSGSKIAQWKDLGVSGDFGEQIIKPLGQVAETMSNVYFRQQVLAQTAYGSNVEFTADTNSLFEALTVNQSAIGFGKVDIADARVKLVPVVSEVDGKSYLPQGPQLLSGAYPLSRFLNVYIVRSPYEPMDEATKDFLTFILSKEGQSIAENAGVIPLSKRANKEELAKLK